MVAARLELAVHNVATWAHSSFVTSLARVIFQNRYTHLTTRFWISRILFHSRLFIGDRFWTIFLTKVAVASSANFQRSAIMEGWNFSSLWDRSFSLNTKAHSLSRVPTYINWNILSSVTNHGVFTTATDKTSMSTEYSENIRVAVSGKVEREYSNLCMKLGYSWYTLCSGSTRILY